MFYDYGLWAGLHLFINLFWLAILIALIVAVVQLLSRSSVASFFTHSEETHYGGTVCQDKKRAQIRQNSAIEEYVYYVYVTSLLPIDVSRRLVVK